MTVTVYGTSDDLIEVYGAIDMEFGYRDDEDNILAFSDGTLLRIAFDRDGIWRITSVEKGAAALKIDHASPSNGDRTDVAALDGDVRWVVHGNGFATAGA